MTWLKCKSMVGEGVLYMRNSKRSYEKEVKVGVTSLDTGSAKMEVGFWPSFLTFQATFQTSGRIVSEGLPGGPAQDTLKTE